MYSLEILIGTGLAAAVAGFIGGYLIALKLAPAEQEKQQLNEELSELQQQQKEYRQDVTEHFTETAQLINQLTTSYQDVHRHLASGAQLLAEDRDDTKLIALAKDQDGPAIVGGSIDTDGEDIDSERDTPADLTENTGASPDIEQCAETEDTVAGDNPKPI